MGHVNVWCSYDNCIWIILGNFGYNFYEKQKEIVKTLIALFFLYHKNFPKVTSCITKGPNVNVAEFSRIHLIIIEQYQHKRVATLRLRFNFQPKLNIFVITVQMSLKTILNFMFQIQSPHKFLWNNQFFVF